MLDDVRRSPLFYVGDKYKLMPQLIKLFPKEISNYYEPFVGGGTVFLNISAKKYFINDLDSHLINIHNFLIKSSEDKEVFFKKVETIVSSYNLSYSYRLNNVPDALKKEYKKTYFAHHNREGYMNLRRLLNSENEKDPLLLYLLLIYGFNRMLRFNKKGEFNIPVGNVDFNKNVVKALDNYFQFVGNKEITVTSQDFRKFFEGRKYGLGDFVYIDPPYLITSSEYNKYWDEECEKNLLSNIDVINKKGVNFALSNVTHYNGRENKMLLEWLKKYKSYIIQSNYISYHNNKKKNIREVLITNY